MVVSRVKPHVANVVYAPTQNALLKFGFTSLLTSVWFASSTEGTHVKKPKRSKKGKHATKRTTVAVKKPSEAPKATIKSTEAAAPTVTRSKAARAHISEGTRLYALAGRPTKAQFVKVYGAKGPAMTWEQRAAAGVPAEKFQEALRAKLGNIKHSDGAVASS